MRKIFFCISVMLMPLYVWAGLSISELTPCNFSNYLNKDNYNFSGYIEFYNDGDSTNLKGCVLTHYKLKKKGAYELKWTWNVDQKCGVGKGKYAILWMDEMAAKNHCPYKLDEDGGYVTIYRDGVRLDSLSYGALTANVAYGRYGTKVGYMEPSPYKENTTAYASLASRCKAPTFSEKGGVKNCSVTVSITAASGCDIYYTLNGSEPTPNNGTLYTAPVKISKTKCLRAIACSANLLPSSVTTVSYIFADDTHNGCGGFTIPIVSLSVDSAYFYDKTIGMCVTGTNGVSGEKDCQSQAANYNRDWKRPVNFEYIVDGSPVLSQYVEAAVEGGCSRSEKVKSLSLKASNKTGVDVLNYHFFKSKPTVDHQTVHVRNGGTAYSDVRFRDGLMQTFAINMNVDYQAYQPVAYYINGVYQGLMALNERTNADYVKANYGLDDEDIDLVTLSDQLGIRASKGTLDAYKELVSYLKSGNGNDSLFYEGACRRMDMDEYIDYQIFQQFIVNTDWPGNNTKLWRDRNDGRFRWILFDTDFGFGLPGYEFLGKSDKNMINWCAGKSQSLQWANNADWMTTIFASLYQNKYFKKKFVTKYLMHLNTTFSDERIATVFDSITSIVKAEYCAFTHGESASNATADMRKFALQRADNIYSQLVDYTGGSSLVNLKLSSEVPGAVFTLNGEEMNGYDGKYIAGYSFKLKVYPPKGYKFTGWQYSNKDKITINSYSKSVEENLPGYLYAVLADNQEITATFTKENIQPTVLFNELCSSNNSASKFADDYGKYADWIEMYNYGDHPYDLAGSSFVLETSKGNVKTSQVPFGYESTIIQPGEHKIFWAKGDHVDGPMYLDFKLNVDDKPFVCLNSADAVSIDCVDMDVALNTNESYGAKSDTDRDMVVFGICKDVISITPGKENKYVECEGTDDALVEVADDKNLVVYPNPAVELLTIQSDSEIQTLQIYDVSGRLLKRMEPMSRQCELNVDSFPAGLYFILAVTNDGAKKVKFEKR